MFCPVFQRISVPFFLLLSMSFSTYFLRAVELDSKLYIWLIGCNKHKYMIYGRETHLLNIFFFYLNWKQKRAHRSGYAQAPKIESGSRLPPLLKKMSLSSNYLHKNPQNNFYSCKQGNWFKWNVISWLCVCWQSFHNEQVAILFGVYITLLAGSYQFTLS